MVAKNREKDVSKDAVWYPVFSATFYIKYCLKNTAQVEEVVDPNFNNHEIKWGWILKICLTNFYFSSL